METFWDTSAIVALPLREPHTATAQAAWEETTRAWACGWTVLETETALARRDASPDAWTQWAALLGALRLLDLEPDQWDALRAFHRALRLRAADAGHLFVFERASAAVPGLKRVAFDTELTDAARRIGLAVL